MGYTVEIQGQPIKVTGEASYPEGILEKNKNKSSYEEFADEYERIKLELFPTKNKS